MLFKITTLVNLKERIKLTDKSKQILKAAGTNIQKAIDSFSNVGQTIAAENDDIADDMNETCSEALKSGEIILKLTDLNESLSLDKAAIVQVSRVLLGSITRSLLLADVVAVKKLVRAAEKVFFNQFSFIKFTKDALLIYSRIDSPTLPTSTRKSQHGGLANKGKPKNIFLTKPDPKLTHFFLLICPCKPLFPVPPICVE